MDQISTTLKNAIKHLEKCYEEEVDALITAGQQANDGDSISMELSFNVGLSIEDRAVLLSAGVSLEERLYQHVEYFIRNSDRRGLQLQVLLQESIGTYRRIPIIHDGMTIANVRGPIDTILLFSPFWIRDPLHWDRNSDVSIIEHLFVEYPVPKGMYGNWYKTWDKMDVKLLVWFIILAQGGSLKRASKWFEWNVSSRYQHFFLQLVKHHSNALSDISIRTLVMGAEINRLGGSERHMMLFSQNPVFRIDPTEGHKYNSEFILFWYQTVHWFINNGQYINDNQYEAILQWAAHQYSEAERDGTFFSWKGRTAGNVIEGSAEYLQKLEAVGEDVHWDYHGLDWRFQDDSDRVWTVNEITSGKELSREGKSLMHCAGEYASRCLAGTAAIFSMKCNQERVATIELDGSLKNVLQARGYKNRMLNQQERSIMNLWFHQVVTTELKEDSLKHRDDNDLQKLLKKYRMKDFGRSNREGNYILHQAAKEGFIEDLRIILDTGFAIDLYNDSGKTALMIAIENRQKEVVKVLIERGADVNVAICPRRNAVAIAIEREDVGMLRLLMKNKAEVWPHHILQALKKRNPCFIHILIKMGANINRSTPKNVTALNLAVKSEDLPLVKKLLELDVNIDLSSYLEAMSGRDTEIARRIRESEKGVSMDYF